MKGLQPTDSGRLTWNKWEPTSWFHTRRGFVTKKRWNKKQRRPLPVRRSLCTTCADVRSAVLILICGADQKHIGHVWTEWKRLAETRTSFNCHTRGKTANNHQLVAFTWKVVSIARGFSLERSNNKNSSPALWAIKRVATKRSKKKKHFLFSINNKIFVVVVVFKRKSVFLNTDGNF